MRALPLAALALLALAALLAGAPAGARAQGGGEQPPTKVVFAIDDSGSMFGNSDPGKERYRGVINLVEVLGRFLSEDDSRSVEVGALSFGADADPLSPPVNVREPALADTLRSARDAAETRGSTNFRGALCLAWQTATGIAAPVGSGCENAVGSTDARAEDARRFVVLITDGAPAFGDDPLPFADSPRECPSALDDEAFAESSEPGAADAYLCALGSVWANLTRHTPVTLIVIGLDQSGDWFDDAAPYWKRAANCAPDADCPRVVRSFDAGELYEQILGALPTIDLCERVAGDESFNCNVPGGLTEVRFQILGVPEGGVTLVGNDFDGQLRSDGDPREFAPGKDGVHIWRFDRPFSDSYRVELETSNPQVDPLVVVDYEPALFDVGEADWNDADGELTFSLTVAAGGRVRPSSAEAQPYRADLRSENLAFRESVKLTHVEGGEGREFTVTMRPDAPTQAFEFVLSLDLGGGRGLIEVARESFDASVFAPPPPAATPEPTPTPAATPEPTPAPTPVPEEPEPEEEDGGFNPLPLIIVILIILAIAAPILISALQVRQPKSYNRRGEKAKPIDLAVPDAASQPQDLVRLGIVAWQKAPPHPDDGDNAERTVMLRRYILGDLVVRRGGPFGRHTPVAEAPERDFTGPDEGEPPLDLAEDIALHNRRPERDDSVF